MKKAIKELTPILFYTLAMSLGALSFADPIDVNQWNPRLEGLITRGIYSALERQFEEVPAQTICAEGLTLQSSGSYLGLGNKLFSFSVARPTDSNRLCGNGADQIGSRRNSFVEPPFGLPISSYPEMVIMNGACTAEIVRESSRGMPLGHILLNCKNLQIIGDENIHSIVDFKIRLPRN